MSLLRAQDLEEALECVLVRVRRYWTRGHKNAIPKATKEAFNRLCDDLGKPDDGCWKRIP